MTKFEAFLVHVFPHSKWILRFRVNLHIRSKCKKTRTSKTRIWTFFTGFDSHTAQKVEVFHEVFHGFLQERWPNPQKTADLVIFTEEILKEKLHFLCSDIQSMGMNILTRWNAKFLVVRCSETGHESYYTDLIKFNILSLAIILQQGGLHYVLRKQYCTAQKIMFSIKDFFE